MMIRQVTLRVCAAGAVMLCLARASGQERPQYELGDIHIPAARADEPLRQQFSLRSAAAYLEQGATAWNGTRKCVTCHTNGSYMLIRPALSEELGQPPQAMREHFAAALADLAASDRDVLKKGTRPAQVIHAAAGLAEWDAHVAGRLSPETRQALALMFELQLDSGTWGSADCWPPYESDAYHLATVAAMAVAAAPGWPEQPDDDAAAKGVERLKNYLRTEPPPHDYGRVLLLWASSRMPDLLDSEQKQQLVEMIWRHQRPDGGWSIRTFAAPEAWGRGNRAEKLRGEPEFADPPSDGHQTGLAIVVLRSCGTKANDPRLRRAVEWLLANQRASGRWWTRSLNTDGQHFITYSGTALSLLALSLCDALPSDGAE